MWENLYIISNSKSTIPMILLGCITVIISLFVYKRVKQEIKESNKSLISCFIVLIDVFICFFILILYLVGVNDYKNTSERYLNGDYMIVEGYVTNYKEDCDKYKHQDDDECFEISGVEFSYRDISSTAGYHRIRKNGGVIRGNNQYLKICYVYESINGKDARNVILRIDELKE